MSVDNTHTKYLKGNDKKAWQNMKEVYEAQKKLDAWFGNLGIPDDLKDGEEYEIPVRKDNKKKKQ